MAKKSENSSMQKPPTKLKKSDPGFDGLIDNLKEQFSTGKVPTQDDYAKFLDLFKVIGNALGISNNGESIDSPGSGLHVNNNKLSVMVDPQKGLAFENSKLTILRHQEDGKDKSGLVFGGGGGLQVSPGAHLEIDKDNKLNVTVKVDTTQGLEQKNNTTFVKIPGGKEPESGLEFDSNGNLNTRIDKNFGLAIDKGTGLFVKYGKELGYPGHNDFSEEKSALRVLCGPGITKKNGKVEVAVGHGLKIDSDGCLSIENDYFAKGMILMFFDASKKRLSDYSVPKGWALCNGKNGTPDMTNSFPVHPLSNSVVDGRVSKSTLTTGGDMGYNWTYVVFIMKL